MALLKFVVGLAAAGLCAGCVSTGSPGGADARSPASLSNASPVRQEAASLPTDLSIRVVEFPGSYPPGTIVVRIRERRLYLVESEGRARRYAVGVGRQEALNFRGSAVVGRKAEWPSWTPTASMMARIPRYRDYAGGLPGGIDNPLGARALYLYRNGRDTHFRLHGTNDPATIGHAVSSGCIRLFNDDVIDLYGRVSIGTPVLVEWR
jgi:lipoprotein-anchoring transpeptidase ErfK/SrfK